VLLSEKLSLGGLGGEGGININVLADYTINHDITNFLVFC
jgi:hypothetical protein